MSGRKQRKSKTAAEKPRLILPPGQDFWVFGYGSLMWHPGFPHVEVRVGHLFGYHRRFCVYSHRYRGTPQSPGLVFGLDRGGSCRGLVFRVPVGEGEEAMAYLYEREMVTGVYNPSWVTVKTEQGTVTCATFVVDQSHEQYTGRLSHEAVADYVSQGQGNRGSCQQYLENTIHHLEALGLGDSMLDHLLSLVKQRRGRGQ